MRRIRGRAFATFARTAAVVTAVAGVQTGCSHRDRAATDSSAGQLDTSATGQPAAQTSIKTSTRAGIGRYLTDANGRSLYMFERDTRNVSTCSDACAAAWPPFAGGARAQDAAVQPPLIGTIERSDSRRQATYNGMPVYYYEDDKKAGDIEGQGKLEFGGLWYLVSPTGRAIKAATPADRKANRPETRQ